MRLDKYLQNLGYGNKEHIHKIILLSKIKVNNKIIDDFHYQINDNDVIEVADDIKKYKEYYYIILNKPDGYVSARKDKYNKTICELLPNKYNINGINIVGRLDKDVTGLVLLTNDTKLYKYIIDPNNKIKKEYLVTFIGNKDFLNIDTSKGIELYTKEKTKPFEIKLLSDNEVLITLYEGKYHEIKKIFKTLNLFCCSITRISISSINLGPLEEGKYRELNKEEISLLKNNIHS